MEFVKKYFYPLTIAVCAVALLIFMGSTNPEQINVGLLVIPVILIFFMTYCLGQLLMSVLKIMKKQPRRRRAVSTVSAMIITVIAILVSTGGLSGVDILLLLLIIFISSIYINKF